MTRFLSAKSVLYRVTKQMAMILNKLTIKHYKTKQLQGMQYIINLLLLPRSTWEDLILCSENTLIE